MILPTTTVTLRRIPAKVDGQDPVTQSVVFRGRPARVSSPSGSEAGAMESASAVLFVDVNVDVRRQDQVTDDATGDVWDVTWVRQHRGLGLDYTSAGLERTKGAP